MALALTGSKTLQIAGTPLQCIEIYTGESYVIPFTFTSSGSPINISGWTLSASAKWYNISGSIFANTATISSIALISPQPSAAPGLAANVLVGASGTGYLYLPTTLTPTDYNFSLDENPVLLCIVTIEVSRVDGVTGLSAINREPVGVLIRYQ